MDAQQYVVNNLEALLPLNTRLNIDHLGSHENVGLQAVDLFCWGIARKVGLGDAEWYAVFQDKVSFTTIYLPENGQ